MKKTLTPAGPTQGQNENSRAAQGERSGKGGVPMDRLAHLQLARQRERYVLACEQGRSYRAVAAHFGVAMETVRRWHVRWRESGRRFEALYNRSSVPGRTRARVDLHTPIQELSGRGLKGLRLIRSLAARGWAVCRATLYSALRRLGLFVKRRRGHRKKPRRLVYPFGHVQADIKYIGNYEGPFQYTAIECATRTRFMRIYPEISQANVVDFFRRMLEFFPFVVHTVTTDNGPEFTYAQFKHVKKEHPVEQLFAEKGIKQRLIPAGRPQYNGRVERSHRTDNESYYSWVPKGEEVAWLRGWVAVYNEKREHMALGWRTPLQALEERLGRPVALDYRLCQL